MRAMAALTLLLFATLSGCTAPDAAAASDETEASEVVERLDAGRGSGYILIEVQREAGIEASGLWTGAWDLDDLNPQQLLLITQDGVEWVWGSTFYDNAPWLTGDGVVYAGAGEHGVETPSVVTNEDDVTTRPLPTFGSDATSGFLLFAWANQEQTLQLELVFPADTHVVRIADGDARGIELKDLRGGARLGSPAVSLSVADAVSLPAAGGQVVVLGNLYRSDASEGELRVTRGSDVQTIPLRGSRTEVNPACCYDEATLFFTATDDTRIDAWQAGNARSTKVLLLAMALPQPVLPETFLVVPFDRTP